MNLIAAAAGGDLHHDILLIVVRFAILLAAARGLGEVAKRLNQPAVIGEILAGIILGPSLLAGLIPGFDALIVPQNGGETYMLEVVSLMGAMFLLLITGLETDVPLIRTHAKTAVSVSLGGIAVTFASGFALASVLPDTFLQDADRRLVFQLFVATAMSVSAIPVVAKVLMDLGLIRRTIGQTILAAGMIDDTVAWTLLSIVLGVAAAETIEPTTLAFAALKIFAFLAVSFTAGRWLIRRLMHAVQDKLTTTDRLLTFVVVVAFAMGAVTQALGIEAVLGAFVSGIIFGTLPRLPHTVVHQLESIALAIFAPLFFASAGLKVDLRILADVQILGFAAAVLAVAVVGKYVGTYFGARVIGGKDHWSALAFGSGLNARGAVEIIIASLGLGAGILSEEMYSVIVVMAMVTSIMAPFGLKWSLARVAVDAEEEQRLKMEEMESDSVLARARRILVPVRLRPIDSSEVAPLKGVEGHLLRRMPEKSATTLLCVVPDEELREPAQNFLNNLAASLGVSELTQRVIVSNETVNAILNEASNDYDLMLLGATERTGENSVFNPFVDQLVRLAPCDVMVTRVERLAEDWEPKRILVPTNGSSPAQKAATVAFSLAKSESVPAEIVAMSSVGNARQQVTDLMGIRQRERTVANAHQMVEHVEEQGAAHDLRVFTQVRYSNNAADAILKEIRLSGVDLIVLGTDLRAGGERLHLGQTVERVLEEATCPVLVVNAS